MPDRLPPTQTALQLDLLLRLLAGTLLEVAGEGTDHALLAQTDDDGVRAPRAGSREVGSRAAHPTEYRWLGRPIRVRPTTAGICRAAARISPGPARLRAPRPRVPCAGPRRQAPARGARYAGTEASPARSARAPAIGLADDEQRRAAHETDELAREVGTAGPGEHGSHPARPGGCGDEHAGGTGYRRRRGPRAARRFAAGPRARRPARRPGRPAC